MVTRLVGGCHHYKSAAGSKVRGDGCRQKKRKASAASRQSKFTRRHFACEVPCVRACVRRLSMFCACGQRCDGCRLVEQVTADDDGEALCSCGVVRHAGPACATSARKWASLGIFLLSCAGMQAWVQCPIQGLQTRDMGHRSQSLATAPHPSTFNSELNPKPTSIFTGWRRTSPGAVPDVNRN